MFLLRGHYASPVDYTDEALEQARAACETLRNRLREGAAAADPALERRGRARRLTTTSTRPRALAAAVRRAGRRRGGTVASCWACWGWAAWRAEEAAPARAARAGRARRERGAAGARLRARRPAARRRSRRPAGRCATRADGPAPVPPWRLTSSTGTSRCARRCAGAARCCGCGARRGPGGQRTGCRPAAVEAADRLDAAGRERRITRAWSPRSAPYPYADAGRAAGRDRPLLVALDEVTDPHNLGAVARVGRVRRRGRPADHPPPVGRGHRGRLPRVGRRGRAPADRAVENLADTLIRPRRPGLWSYAAAGGAERRYDRHDYRDGTVFVLGAEGRGLRPRVRAACDEGVADPDARAGSSR